VSALFWTRGGGGDRGARYAPLSLSTRSTITTSCLPMRSSLLMERMRRRDSSVIKIIPSTSLYSSSLTYAPISSMLFTCTAKVCGWQSSKGAPSKITAWERQFWGGGVGGGGGPPGAGSPRPRRGRPRRGTPSGTCGIRRGPSCTRVLHANVHYVQRVAHFQGFRGSQSSGGSRGIEAAESQSDSRQ
jgi:hypothetical protein